MNDNEFKNFLKQDSLKMTDDLLDNYQQDVLDRSLENSIDGKKLKAKLLKALDLPVETTVTEIVIHFKNYFSK